MKTGEAAQKTQETLFKWVSNARSGNLTSNCLDGVKSGCRYVYDVFSSSVSSNLKGEAAKAGKISPAFTKGLVGLGVFGGLAFLVATQFAEDVTRHTQIQTRSGGFMTSYDDNKTMMATAGATTALGAATVAKGAAGLTGAVATAGGASAGGLAGTIAGGAAATSTALKFGLGAVTGVTKAVGSIVHPGLGALMGSPMTLIAAGALTHGAMKEYFIKMPQGQSIVNNIGFGGKKLMLDLDPNSPFFLQSRFQKRVMRKILEEHKRGLNRPLPIDPQFLNYVGQEYSSVA